MVFAYVSIEGWIIDPYVSIPLYVFLWLNNVPVEASGPCSSCCHHVVK